LWRIPADGVGLARMEFVVSNQIKVQRTTATIAKPDRVSFSA